MTTPMFDCLVAGDANIDLLVDGVVELEVGTEKLATDLSLVLGGSSAITAFNLARLGAGVRFAGRIGNDLFGRFVAERLHEAGVDISGLRRMNDAKTGVTIWHSEQGRRAGVTYPGTVSMLEAEDVGDGLLGSARHLHVGAYFLQTRLHEHAPELFARARRFGLTASVDCNWDPAERWDSNLRAVLEQCDVFLPNEQEAMRITGEPDAVRAAHALAQYVRIVVVKRGGEGALAVTGETEISVPAIPVEAVDTTGAGDSFNAGFLSRFVKGSELRECVEAGIHAGWRNVQYVGGTAAFEKVLH